MKIETFRLRPDSPGRVLVSWTSAHPDWYAWIFVDGLVRVGPIVGDATQPARSASILWPLGETHAVEVHELPTLEPIGQAVAPAANLNPVISWNARRSS